jgi:hypothetical protein
MSSVAWHGVYGVQADVLTGEHGCFWVPATFIAHVHEETEVAPEISSGVAYRSEGTSARLNVQMGQRDIGQLGHKS